MSESTLSNTQPVSIFSNFEKHWRDNPICMAHFAKTDGGKKVQTHWFKMKLSQAGTLLKL